MGTDLMTTNSKCPECGLALEEAVIQPSLVVEDVPIDAEQIVTWCPSCGWESELAPVREEGSR